MPWPRTSVVSLVFGAVALLFSLAASATEYGYAYTSLADALAGCMAGTNPPGLITPSSTPGYIECAYTNSPANGAGTYYFWSGVGFTCGSGSKFYRLVNAQSGNIDHQPEGNYLYCTGNFCPPPNYQNELTGSCISPYAGAKTLGPPNNCPVGNPCNAGNGNKYQSESDFRAANSAPSLTRHYNSQLLEDSGFGFGWASPFQKRFEISGSTVQIRQADGRGEPFTCTNNVCTGDADTKMVLTQDSSGYTLTYRDNATDRYDTTGKLLSETKPTGQITVYAYDSSGRVSTVTDAFGHQLTFGYTTSNHVASVTDPTGNPISYTYDVNNNLTRVNYPDSTAKIYYYEDANNPHSLTGIAYVDNLGNTTRFSTYGYYYNPNNIGDPSNGKAILTEHVQTDNGSPQEKFTLAYDTPAVGQTTVTSAPDWANGKVTEIMTFATNLGVKNLVSKTSSIDTKSLQQAFDANNNLTCTKDEEGHVTTYTYNATNQKLSLTEGLTGDCSNPPASTVSTSVTRTTAYQYVSTTLDLPTVVTSPSVYPGQSKTTTIGYGNNIAGDVCNGQPPYLPCQITQAGFTPSGAAVSRTVILGYNGYGQIATLTDPNGSVTQLNYNLCTTGNGCGQLSSVTNALTQVTTYDNYDTDGRLLQMTDPNGVVTTYTYDPRGRVKTITQTPPAGSPAITQYSFTPLLGPITTSNSNDAHDRRLKRTDRERRKTRHTDDTRGQVQTTTQTSTAMTTSSFTTASTTSASWQYSYTPWGDVSQVIDPDGVVLNYTYDAAHYLRTISDGAGNSLRYSYDLKGNRTTDATYDPSGVLTRTVSDGYDLRNHLAGITSAGNLTTILNDALGHVQSATDQNQHTTHYNYDPLYRLYSILDAANGTTTYTYDVNDRSKAVTAPNNLTTQYSVDDLGNRLQEISPDRGTTKYVYDAAGNVLTQTDARAQVTTYTYDALNRVSTKQSSAAFTKPYIYNYDSCYRGQLCSIGDGAMPVMTFGYDGLGRMNYSGDIYSGLSSQFAYSPGGRLTSITDPSGRTVNYAYDTLGHVNAVSTTYNNTTTVLAANIGYHPFGPMAAFGFGNGLSYQAQFDTAYRPTLRADGVYAESITGYDGADNILARTAPGAQSFTYDALNRLWTATDNNTGGFGTLGYAYDPNGNRQSETRNGTAMNYIYSPSGSNWLSQVGSESRLPNPDGSTASTTSLGALSYDGYGDLTGAGAAYAYDPFGRRNEKNTGGPWISFAYGPHGELLYETDGTNTKSYVYLNGTPVARLDNNSQIYYYHDDHLGSPQAMTDATGATVWKAYYEPFGNATVTTQTVINNLRLPGQYFDAETGLHYNGARYYDPRIGRYISSDPVGLDGGLNTYLYARANPLRFTDPFGLAACQGTWELLDEIMAPGIFSTFTCKCRYVCKTCDGRYTGITTDVRGFPSTPDEGGANAGVGNGKGGNRGTKILPGDPTHCECKRPGGETGCKTCPANGDTPTIGGAR